MNSIKRLLKTIREMLTDATIGCNWTGSFNLVPVLIRSNDEHAQYRIPRGRGHM